MSDLLLCSLCPVGTAPTPLPLDALSSMPGSGAAMEDWLQSVVSGGDSGCEEAAAAQEDGLGGEEDEYADEPLLPGLRARGAPAAGCGHPLIHPQQRAPPRSADGPLCPVSNMPGTCQPPLPALGWRPSLVCARHLPAEAAQGLQGDSEYDVWVRHAEGLLGRATGSFSSDLLPAVLRRFQRAGAAFEGACQAAAAGVAQAVAAGGAGAPPAAVLDAGLPTFQGMDVCLRLLTRCGPSFPTRGAANASSGLAPPAGEPVSGAHAVQCLRATLQLAGGWLHAVQAIAGASQQQGQQQGQPATPSLTAAAGSGGLPALLLAGSWLYKAAGSLTATWLSQLLAGLAQGSADPDAAAVAQQAVQGLLSAAAALLQAVASPQLAGWQPLLYRAAVWAAESLVSLSSVALSSALKPPVQLLEGVWRSHEVQARARPGEGQTLEAQQSGGVSRLSASECSGAANSRAAMRVPRPLAWVWPMPRKL